jgi:hypothetical protein
LTSFFYFQGGKKLNVTPELFLVNPLPLWINVQMHCMQQLLPPRAGSDRGLFEQEKKRKEKKVQGIEVGAHHVSTGADGRSQLFFREMRVILILLGQN